MSQGLRIVPLAERPDLILTVARWGFGEWGHLALGATLDDRLARVCASTRTDRPPIIVVALDRTGVVVGMASLIFDDLKGDPRNPWLASVYVPPEARRAGLGSQLVGAIEGLARRFGYRRLYLFTASAPQLYAGLGWRALEQRAYRGEEVTVMAKELA
ncbi:MAG TPA: GNAT family N-acetyltransferase [Vineibacter sp.]|nr:GNAT family N-acetyltransferase [Vineibacter sp.]